MQQMAAQQAEVNRALTAYLIQNEEIFASIRKMYALSLQTSALTPIVKPVHHSWLRDLRVAQLPSAQVSSIAQLTLSNISHDLALTDRILPRIDYANLRSVLAPVIANISAIQASMASLLINYNRLVESFQSIDHVVQSPSFILPGATRELSATGYAIDVLNQPENRQDYEVIYPETDSVETRDGEDSILVDLLEPIGQEFVTMYRGAVAALSDNNPDRSRHVLTSLRELWNHVLRRLAPQDKVEAWAQAQCRSQDYLHDGKPTRRAKIGYILKELRADPLQRFVDADTKSMVELYEVYGRLHSLDAGLTDEQLRAITLKSEFCLIFLLRVRRFSTE